MNQRGRADIVKSEFDRIDRETDDRRALRDRNMEAAKEESENSLQRQGEVSNKFAEHMSELARRERESDPWTAGGSKSDAEDLDLGYLPEDDEEEVWEEISRRVRSAVDSPVATSEQNGAGDVARPGQLDDEFDEDFSNRRWI